MKVVSNSAISLDGKLTTPQNEAISLGSAEDLKRMSHLRNWADAVVVGGKTFRNWPEAMIPNKDHLEADEYNSKKKLCVIVSRTMDVPLTASFFCEKTVHPLFLTIKENVPEDFPCEVIACENEITPQWILEVLESRGAKNILIEAGGNLLFQFIHDNMIDEMNITLCPKIIGGTTSPSLVAGSGFSAKDIRDLELLQQETIGSEIFLKYKLKKKLNQSTENE